MLDGYPTEYVRKARREAERADEFLRAGPADIGESALAARLTVGPVVAIAGAGW